jgi:hypothetical protein
MAMPVGSMIEKFRAEFEAHIEKARAENPFGDDFGSEDLPATGVLV